VHKLPVFATAGLVYRFLFGELGTIARLSWFPLLLVFLVQYAVAYFAFGAMRAALPSVLSGDPATTFKSNLVWQAAGLIALLAGTSVVAVALHRVILFGDRKPGRLCYFAFGKIELLFLLLPLVAYATLFSINLLVVLNFRSLPTPGFFVLLSVSAGFALLWLALRLLLIFPVLVVEGHYDFSEAWTLTRRNFWRMVGTLIVTGVPLILVMLAIQLLLMSAMGFDLLPRPGAGGTDPMRAMLEQQFRLTFSIPMMVFSYLAMIAYGAIGVGLLSYSYKALSGHAPDELLRPRS
jgi:hypothetical protein